MTRIRQRFEKESTYHYGFSSCKQNKKCRELKVSFHFLKCFNNAWPRSSASFTDSSDAKIRVVQPTDGDFDDFSLSQLSILDATEMWRTKIIASLKMNEVFFHLSLIKIHRLAELSFVSQVKYLIICEMWLRDNWQLISNIFYSHG